MARYAAMFMVARGRSQVRVPVRCPRGDGSADRGRTKGRADVEGGRFCHFPAAPRHAQDPCLGAPRHANRGPRLRRCRTRHAQGHEPGRNRTLSGYSLVLPTFPRSRSLQPVASSSTECCSLRARTHARPSPSPSPSPARAAHPAACLGRLHTTHSQCFNRCEGNATLLIAWASCPLAPYITSPPQRLRLLHPTTSPPIPSLATL